MNDMFLGKGNYELTADYLREEKGLDIPRNIGRRLHLAGLPMAVGIER